MTEDINGIKRWPGYTDVAHPELFNTIPPQPQQLKPGQLNEEQIKKFFDEGFLLLESVLKPEELDPANKAIDGFVDELANTLYAAGKIKNLYDEYGHDSRLSMIEKEFPGANILLHKLGKLPKHLPAYCMPEISRLNLGSHLQLKMGHALDCVGAIAACMFEKRESSEFQDIWTNERLMNVAEQILGTSDIAGHPVWNLRTKTPNSEAATVPWHQDVAYLDNRSYDVFQLTAWIPLMNATEETGCLQIVRNGHKTGRVATHTCCAGETWYVMLSEDEIRKTLECDLERDVVTIPVNYGSVLLFSNIIPHRSLNNKSNIIRWSLDLRWQRADKSPGFYDIKDCIRLRSSSDPNFKPDWEAFANTSRQDTHVENPDKFDTTVVGPWMLKWEMTHTNRHTDALKRGNITSWHSSAFA